MSGKMTFLCNLITLNTNSFVVDGGIFFEVNVAKSWTVGSAFKASVIQIIARVEVSAQNLKINMAVVILHQSFFLQYVYYYFLKFYFLLLICC